MFEILIESFKWLFFGSDFNPKKTQLVNKRPCASNPADDQPVDYPPAIFTTTEFNTETVISGMDWDFGYTQVSPPVTNHESTPPAFEGWGNHPGSGGSETTYHPSDYSSHDTFSCDSDNHDTGSDCCGGHGD